MVSRFSCAPSLLLLSLAFACGGRTQAGDRRADGQPSPPEAEATGGVSGTGGGAPADASTTPPDPSDPDPSGRVLGDCTPGLPKSAAAGQCPWVADDLCYPTKEAACDCVCPQTTNSTCLSGLPGGPDAQTPVTCF